MKLTISSNEIPIIDRAGQFPLLNATFDFIYCNKTTHALHLYGYDGTIRIDSDEIAFKKGDITCIKSGSAYAYSVDHPDRHWCIHFIDQPTMEDLSIEIPNHISLGANSVFFREQIKHISSLFNSKGTNKITDLESLEAKFRLKALLLSISREPSFVHIQTRSNNFNWEKLLFWIDENINQPISSASLAERANLSPNTLAQKFKKQYNTTITQYILHKRIDKAKTLLTGTEMTIYEIGELIGISDPQYFNKQFRKVTGISPSAHRRKNKHYVGSIVSALATKEGTWQQKKTNQ
ncbi:MAG: helix-turn-helix domain-containing protein [Planctomycetota bacterium]|jgi:AraC-like DNA-binding protein